MEKNKRVGEKTALLNRHSPASDNQGSLARIGPMVFLHTLAWSLSEVKLTDQIVYQACVLHLGTAEGACSQLRFDDDADRNSTTTGSQLEQVVQPFAASVSMAIVLLTSVIPALAALFFGPWSERFGRKPVIAVASVGYLLSYLMIALIGHLSTYYIVTPWFYVVANIPVAFLGGFSVFNAGIFSYMNDVSNESNRTVRMGALQGFTILGVLSGLFASSWTAGAISITTSFLISAAVQLLSLLLLFFLMRESVQVDRTVSSRQKLAAIFKLDRVRDMERTLLQDRPDGGRTIVWFLIAIGGMVELATAGRVLFFLYTRHEFNWNIKQYSLWLSSEFAVIMLGNLFGILALRKLLNMSDIGLLLLSTFNHLGDFLIKGFARQGWQLYLTTFLTPFKGIDGAASRSLLSTILPADEVGRTYAMDLSVKALTPLVSVFLLTSIYNGTLDSDPSVFLFVTCLAFVLNLGLVGSIYYLLGVRQEKIAAESASNLIRSRYPLRRNV